MRVGDKAIQEITALPVDVARQFFASLEFPEHQAPVAAPIIAEIANRLDFLVQVGLEYLSLDRPADTLSGGELQRIRLATGIGSGLVGVCYILDEPSIGLHPRDNGRLIQALRNLQHQGNTVLVVEHDEAIMHEADQLINVGPGGPAWRHDRRSRRADGTRAGGAFHHRSVPCQAAGDSRPVKRRHVSRRKAITIEGASANVSRISASRFRWAP